jgi:transposase-like protein
MNCPDCKVTMGKAGKAWSGKTKVQRWRCNKCGKTTTKNK